MMGEGGGMWFGGGFMWFFWIVLIIFAVWAVKAASDSGANSSNNRLEDSPMEILKKRYACGDIDEAEYERRRKELES